MSIKDFFFENDNKTTQNVSGNSITNTPNTLGSIIPPVSSHPFATTTSDTLDESGKFTDHFDQLFKSANFIGPDYYEFSKMVEAMTASGMNDDAVKLNAAFAGLVSQGLTKTILLNTAQQYINVIDEDAKKFDTALTNKIDTDLQAKQGQLKQLQDTMTQKTDLIKQLQKEILQHQTDTQNLTNDIADQQQKKQSKVTNYKTASKVIKDQITSDIQKINTYLK